MEELSLNYKSASLSDAAALADIRSQAMKPSLVELGRFDERRVKQRLLNHFLPDDTWKIFHQETLIGFYVLIDQHDHLYLSHLYISPDYQSLGIGGTVIQRIQRLAKELNKPIRLGALKGSRSNHFYLRHGFVPTHSEEFDIYYQFEPRIDRIS